MSDELELDYEEEVVDGPSAGETHATDPAPASRQPQAVANLDDDPRFRAFKSSADSRISQAEQRARYVEQQYAETQRQLQQVYMQGMDETQKLQYMLQLKDQELAQERRARELDAFAQQRQRDLQEIARRTGAPVDLLTNARDTFEAWSMADEFRQKQGKQRVAQDEPVQQVDDRVEVGGGGKPLSQAQRLQRDFNKALDDKDLSRQWEIMDKAMLSGVKLRDKYGGEY